MRLSAPIYLLKRRAKLLARSEGIELHAALDRVAQEEGFPHWSLLSSRLTTNSLPSLPRKLLVELNEGDLLLIGARPGHGKTMVAMRLLLEARLEGRRAVLFTLDYTERQARERIDKLSGEDQPVANMVEVVTSDDICADFIVRHLADAPKGVVAAVDYLQVLDQQRDKPPLAVQMATLQQFAKETGAILAFVSQIDRAFDPMVRKMPNIEDVRLPNRIDLSVFSKALFLHEGRTYLHAVT